VPTHSLELVEAAAARQALAPATSKRLSPRLCMDVLVQHLVSMALGSGFRPSNCWPKCAAPGLSRVARQPVAMGAGLRLPRRQLTDAYPDYQRVERHADGVYRVASERLARRHRMGIGTIVSDASLQLKYWSKGGGGKTLGSVEEVHRRLRPGDAGVAGRCWNWCGWKT
jgi:ATP-dependent Lhr-like helicase